MLPGGTSANCVSQGQGVGLSVGGAVVVASVVSVPVGVPMGVRVGVPVDTGGGVGVLVLVATILSLPVAGIALALFASCMSKENVRRTAPIKNHRKESVRCFATKVLLPCVAL